MRPGQPPAPGDAPGGPTLLRSRIDGLRTELRTPLYRNAYALMLNTLLNSGAGLLYWIVAARSFSDHEVGRGNALISLMMLVSVLTQFNFSQALIRFLPRSGTATTRLIAGAYGVSTGTALLGASAVMAYCHLLTDPADPLHVSWGFAGWFVASTAAWSLFNLQDAVLTGLRSASWVPLENGIYGLMKLGLLLAVARTSLADGVFTSWTLPIIALLVPVSLLIFRRVLPRHVAATRSVQQVPSPRRLLRFLAGDFTGQVFSQLSSTFLPVLVVGLLGAAQGAYFLPAQTALGSMAMLTMAITSSLMVEAAKDEAHTDRYARAVLRRIAVTVLPAAVLIALAAPWLLQLFGSQYRANSTFLLQLLMVSIFPRVVVSLFVTKSRLENRTGRLAVLQSAQAVLLIGATLLLSRPLGLVAVGWAVLAAELIPAAVLGGSVWRWLRPARDSALSA